MQKENQLYNIQPADRLANVSEYYFSRKLKEVARMNAEGKDRKKPSTCCARTPRNPTRTAISLPWASLNCAVPWQTGTSAGTM